MDGDDGDFEGAAGDWYAWWVAVYARSTAAPAEVTTAFLENRDVFLGTFRATREELDECLRRLVAGCRVPKFPNEHTDAVGRELNELRVERARARRPDPAAPDESAPPGCVCGPDGIVTIPHRRCVYERRIVLHPEVGMVVTGGVLCDRPGCERGELARRAERERKTDRPRAALSQAERFHNCDLIALYREFEREQARRARAAAGGEERGVWDVLRRRIERKASDRAGRDPRGEAA